MIAPNMATLLAIVLTDAAINPHEAQSMLRDVADVSFNRVSVDGHTSTNDTLLLLASGQGEPLQREALLEFKTELTEVCVDLAKQLVADGEGARHWFEIAVTGAEHTRAANVIAETVAASPLVKTAITGADPNWGRIVSAAGYADALIEPNETSLEICGVAIYRNGHPVEFDRDQVRRKMQQRPEVKLKLVVGTGPGEAIRWSSDLTTEYVRFNSEYTT